MIRTLLLVAALVLPVLAPVAAQEADGPSGTISTVQGGATDAAIQSRIAAILGELEGYETVSVDVREGVVTFSGEVLDGESVSRLEEIAARVDGVVAIENDIVENTDVGQRLDPVLDRFETRLFQFLSYLPLLVISAAAGVCVVFAGVLLARWDWPWRRFAPNAFIAEIYRVILRLAFLLAGVVVALDILNATAILTGLLGAAGIVGLAVGFAVRDTVENFIASVMLSLRQPFHPNDVVDIEGSMGTVVRLTSRATILLDQDGNHVRLPNATVFKSKIVNYTRNDTRRFSFLLGIDPADDLSRARRIGLDTLAGLDFVLDEPGPQAWVAEAGDSTVSMEFLGWIDQRHSEFPVARGEALRMVMTALTGAGIGLPEPSYRLNLTGGGLPVIDLPDDEGSRSRSLTVTEGGDAEAPAPPTPQDVSADRTIARMVEKERSATAGDDLLSRSGRVE